MKYADIILPRGLDNHVAIEMIVGHVSRELENRALELRTPLSLLSRPDVLEVDILPASTVTDFVASVLKLHGGIGKDVMGLVVQDAGFTSFDDEISKLVPTATIVIDFHSKTHDPILVDCHIHSDIKNMSILIFNTQIASGAAALMAIRVMLDHGALQENIILCALVCSKMGINSVKNAFPKVRLYATKLVDYQLQDGPRIEHGY